MLKLVGVTKKLMMAKRVLVAGSDVLINQKRQAVQEWKKAGFEAQDACDIYKELGDPAVLKYLQGCRYLYVAAGYPEDNYVGTFTTLLIGYAKALAIPIYFSCAVDECDYKVFCDSEFPVDQIVVSLVA